MQEREVVVITGGSAGVGLATVREFAKRRAKIAILARGRDRLDAAVGDVEKIGGTAIGISVDVADPRQVEDAAERIERELGPIDIWINDAMTTVFSEFVKVTPDEFKRITEVTYLGYVHGTMAALKRMMARNRGTIVQVGSALAYRSIPLQSGYCGAKHAIAGFTDSIRSELKHRKSGIWITMVQLPAVNTPQFSWCKNNMPRKGRPVPPIYQPEVIARGIYWAAHHRRREFIIGLNTFIIIWGNKFFPGLGDWYLAGTGYESQQYNGPSDPGQPNNLWQSVPGDFKAQGDFSGRAKDTSRFMHVAELPGFPYYGLGIAACIILWLCKCKKRNRRRTAMY